MLDLTQSGCTVKELAEKDCDNCGVSKDGKCISVFNHIPTFNIYESWKNFEKNIYTKTYNYDTNESYHKNKLFVCEPDWMRISMYRELTEPIDNPGRLVKVSTRLDKLNAAYPTKVKSCDQINYVINKMDNSKHSINLELKKHILKVLGIKHKDLKNKSKIDPRLNNDLMIKYLYDFNEVLEHINEYVNNRNLVHYGISAYNFYTKGVKGCKDIDITDYDVYVQE